MMQKFLLMISDFKKICLVLDLDDTLYQEYDYQTSGLKFVEKQVLELYGFRLKGRLLELRDQGVSDIFLELTKILRIPTSIKFSFLMMYRYHKPNISLSVEAKKFIETSIKKFKQVIILTDGRSVTQRLKLEALGLLKMPLFISEEWDSEKPDKKRFIAIMQKYNFCSKFFYIADNLTKDFIAPNELGWTSICLRGNKKNIFSQKKYDLNPENSPNYWVNSLTEVNIC